jgi:hypothetical protein
MAKVLYAFCTTIRSAKASAYFAVAELDRRSNTWFAFIDDHRAVYGVEPICNVLPIAPSTYCFVCIGPVKYTILSFTRSNASLTWRKWLRAVTSKSRAPSKAKTASRSCAGRTRGPLSRQAAQTDGRPAPDPPDRQTLARPLVCDAGPPGAGAAAGLDRPAVIERRLAMRPPARTAHHRTRAGDVPAGALHATVLQAQLQGQLPNRRRGVSWAEDLPLYRNTILLDAKVKLAAAIPHRLLRLATLQVFVWNFLDYLRRSRIYGNHDHEPNHDGHALLYSAKIIPEPVIRLK